MAAEKSSNCELPLPKGWIRSTSKKFNKSYYYHEKTKCSIWVHPALLYPEDEGEDESLVSTTTSTHINSNEEFQSLSKSDDHVAVPGKKTHSSSSIFNYLGLSTASSATESQNNVVKSESSSFSESQCLKRMDRKSHSTTTLLGITKRSSDLLKGQNRTYDGTVDDLVEKGSPINANEEHWSKILGHDNQSRPKVQLGADKINKRNLLRSHPYKKGQHLSQTGLYEAEKSALTGANTSNWTVNIASTNQTFISVSNEVGETRMQPPVKPSLKPLLPKLMTKRENRKRHSSETVNAQTQDSDIQFKIIKSDKEQCQRNSKKESSGKTDNENNEKHTYKIDPIKVLTPAMKAVIAKRSKAGYPALERDGSSKVELVKSSAKKIPVPKNISGNTKGNDKESSVSKPTPAMLAIMKKREEKQKKIANEDNVCDSTTSHDGKKDKEEVEEGDQNNNEQGIVSKIWNKCFSFRRKLKPLKPSEKMKNVFNQYPKKVITPEKVSPKPGPSTTQCISPTKIPEHIKVFSNECAHDVVEDMDIDDFEITKGVRDLREDVVFQKPQIVKTDEPISLPTYSDPLFVVLDTNVLLSNLKFVLELKDYRIPSVGPPILIIPWIVFQELDSLKDAVKRYHIERSKGGTSEKSYDLSVLARKAINSIGKCLDAEHPRVRGQSAIEAGTPIKGFSIKSNDDSIIHCGLALKRKALESHIVMLSNDRNLCNKSIVVGIKAFSHHNIINCLKKMFRDNEAQHDEYGTDVITKSKNYQPKEDSKIKGKSVGSMPSSPQGNINKEDKTDNVPIQRNIADEFFCEMQHLLRNDFSKIIETEMVLAYDENLWLSIVKIKPPWTFQDTLVLFEKHWIAVFGNLVSRNLKQTVIKLKDMYSDAKTECVNNDSVRNMLQLGLGILKGFQKHSEYDGLISTSIDKLLSYLNQLPGSEMGSSNDNQACSSSGTSKIYPSKISLLQQDLQDIKQDSISESSRNVHPGNCELQPSPYEKVRLTLDELWNTANYYSALVFTSLNFPSPLVKELDPQHAIPSVEESLLCLNVMTPCILNLVKSIHSLISNDGANGDTQQLLSNLLESMYSFFREVMKRECAMQPDDLLVFCQDSSTKEIFIQGLSQLDRLYAMLQQCAELQRCG